MFRTLRVLHKSPSAQALELIRMLIGKPKAREKYVSLTRAAEVLQLEESQLNQYFVTGQLLAAIVYHKPSDYRETREITLKDGTNALSTRTNRTSLKIVSPDHRENEIMYLDPDDTARIILNKIEKREMLISRLYRDRDLNPKQGLGLLGDSAITVATHELVVTSEELGRFAKEAKIKLKPEAKNEIDIPPRPWYDRPPGRTLLAIIAIIIASIISMWVKNEL